MSTSVVDRRHRIVIGKQVRRKTNINAGDVVVIEPIDENSFRVTRTDLATERLEDDPAWKAICTPVKAKRYVPPEELEEFMEEVIWRG